MGKKGNDIVIHCDSPEVNAVLMQFFSTYKEQIEETIKQALGQSGVQSDPTFKVHKDGTIKVGKTNYDKGIVLIAMTSDSLSTKAYKELDKGAVYALPHKGAFGVFQKTNKGIDMILGHFHSWENLAEGLATVPAVADNATEAVTTATGEVGNDEANTTEMTIA